MTFAPAGRSARPAGTIFARLLVPSLSILAAAALFVAPPAAGGPRPPRRPTAVILGTTDGGERLVEVDDLAFASFERVYFRRSVDRSENLERQRIDIESRRQECECLRLDDWSTIKFKELRQIEIDYPVDGRAALLRLTHRDGSITTVPADGLYGAAEPLPPRLFATIDGVVREYRLMLPDPKRDRWPEERLTRVLLRRPAVNSRRR